MMVNEHGGSVSRDDSSWNSEVNWLKMAEKTAAEAWNEEENRLKDS